jgi:hypothetical protein
MCHQAEAPTSLSPSPPSTSAALAGSASHQQLRLLHPQAPKPTQTPTPNQTPKLSTTLFNINYYPSISIIYFGFQSIFLEYFDLFIFPKFFNFNNIFKS